MQVVHALASLDAVVNNHAESLVQLFLFRDRLRGVQEMPQQLLVVLVRLAELGQAGADLRDHQEVRLRLRRDVAERHAQRVLVNHVRGDVPGDDLVEQRGLARVGHAFQVRLKSGGLLVPGGGHGDGPGTNARNLRGVARRSAGGTGAGDGEDGRTQHLACCVHVGVERGSEFFPFSEILVRVRAKLATAAKLTTKRGASMTSMRVLCRSEQQRRVRHETRVSQGHGIVRERPRGVRVAYLEPPGGRVAVAGDGALQIPPQLPDGVVGGELHDVHLLPVHAFHAERRARRDVGLMRVVGRTLEGRVVVDAVRGRTKPLPLEERAETPARDGCLEDGLRLRRRGSHASTAHRRTDALADVYHRAVAHHDARELLQERNILSVPVRFRFFFYFAQKLPARFLGRLPVESRAAPSERDESVRGRAVFQALVHQLERHAVGVRLLVLVREKAIHEVAHVRPVRFLRERPKRLGRVVDDEAVPEQSQSLRVRSLEPPLAVRAHHHRAFPVARHGVELRDGREKLLDVHRKDRKGFRRRSVRRGDASGNRRRVRVGAGRSHNGIRGVFVRARSLRTRLQSTRLHLLTSPSPEIVVGARLVSARADGSVGGALVAHPRHAVVPEKFFERRILRQRFAQRVLLVVGSAALRLARLVSVELASRPATGGGRGVAARALASEAGASVPGSARLHLQSEILLAALFQLLFLFPQLALHADELALEARQPACHGREHVFASAAGVLLGFAQGDGVGTGPAHIREELALHQPVQLVGAPVHDER
mmetsp:Transcript_12814/g.53697  ORF Transcript_12814/g.53697 Transcript_12814/m.53697 type:complete len:771 (+) Transcript_12814:992-3304(+)